MAEPSGPDIGLPHGGMGIAGATHPEADDLRCCCGKDDCVFLRHNCSILSSVERDVHAAARMGQTLLARHEAYMTSAERDRLELAARIDELERDNVTLEAKNKSVTDENHGLRDELEQLNNTVKDAETKIELLEATLRDSQREVRRLEVAADRAAALERQVAILEEEQVVLRTNINRSEEEARATMYRWKQAEKQLGDLEEQLERMEEESREERERHVEAVGRMERQRAMEKELNTAAGRLKGAAAVKSMTDSRNGGNVVSHFVRDLLQDNANLQLGIAELREMLLSSNDEIQTLREQLLYQQSSTGQELGSSATLQAELDRKEPPTPPPAPRVQQELHIHHHYHVTPKPESRKPRKRRQGLNAGIFTPPQISAPGSPVATSARWQRSMLAGPLMSPPANTSGLSSPARWSLQSEAFQPEPAPSSAPSSPRSTNRDSMFDRVPDLPSPASPTTSVDPTSPTWKATHGKKVSEFSLRSISETAMFPADASQRKPTQDRYPHRPRPLARFLMAGLPAPAITSPYTTDDVPTLTSPSLADYTDDESLTAAAGHPFAADPTAPVSTADEHDAHFTSSTPPSPTPTSPSTTTTSPFNPTFSLDQTHSNSRTGDLRRVISHESIMSLSNGLDIHTLKARPSQLALRPLLGFASPGTSPAAATAELSAVTATVRLVSGGGSGGGGSGSGGVGGKRGSVILRDSFAAAASKGVRPGVVRGQGGGRTVSGPVVMGGNVGAGMGRGRGREKEERVGRPAAEGRAPSALGRLVAWRPWGQGHGHAERDGQQPADAGAQADANGAAPPTAVDVVVVPAPDADPASAVGADATAEAGPDGSNSGASATKAAAKTIPTISLPVNNPAPDTSRSPQPALASPTATSAASDLSRSPHGSLASTATATTSSSTTAAAAAASADFMKTVFRAPGINQPGVVPGFHEYWAAHQRRGPPSKVSVGDVEGVQEALREVLEES